MESKYGGGLITNAQYLAEIVTARYVYKHLNCVPDKFWQETEWKKHYKTQIIAANGLLKIYSIESILDVINSNKYSWSYSLNIKSIKDELAIRHEVHQKTSKVQTITETPKTIHTADTTTVPKIIQITKNISSLLD